MTQTARRLRGALLNGTKEGSRPHELAAEQALKEQEIEQVLSQTLCDELAAEIESQKLNAENPETLPRGFRALSENIVKTVACHTCPRVRK